MNLERTQTVESTRARHLVMMAVPRTRGHQNFLLDARLLCQASPAPHYVVGTTTRKDWQE